MVYVCLLTVSKEALVVLDSSGTFFFPVKTFLRFFLTSLLKIMWKKKMKTPCERKTRDEETHYKHQDEKDVDQNIRVRIIEQLMITDIDQHKNIRCITCRQLKTANR